MENVFCVILAGGVGNRLWPVSNTKCPKQFMDLLHTGKTLIRQTFERINLLIPKERIYVVTGKRYIEITQKELPEIPQENILAEPFRKNTAVSIMYAAVKVRKKSENSTMIVVASDHVITNEVAYLRNLKEGVEFVKNQGGLLTFGIKPKRQETQYGYIQEKKPEIVDKISEVKTFTEKPDKELAKAFFESGDFLWNVGIFVWKTNDIISEIKKYTYDVYSFFEDDKFLDTEYENEAIVGIYSEVPNVSIDFGVLEKSASVYVLKGDFGWSNTSTWLSLNSLGTTDDDNNTLVSGNVVFDESKNCLVYVNPDKKVIVSGVDNIIIAEQHDYLMICNKDNEERIKLFEKNF
ncbi:MAG: mannose-1-phosphate guanylyltransferase [Culturomica sp.]|jgi:mannose-1-phosphate guanylyltransferase|nr:mannose-1-phosphate guanylyltransferase [Culturomica sp.]